MERPLTDDDIVTFLRTNKRKYNSEIELLQAAVQLLWPHGPPADAGMRVARLALLESNHPRPRTSAPSAAGPVRTRPLGTGRLPRTSPLG